MTAHERATIIRGLELCNARLADLLYAPGYSIDRWPEIREVLVRLAIVCDVLECIWDRDERAAARAEGARAATGGRSQSPRKRR
jgi:hypothetical protein